MTYQELRQLIKDVPKYEGVEEIPPASVCNPGFPGTFNLSFTEPEMLETFGQYLDFKKDLCYSKIQPVVRHQDWKHIMDGDKHSYRYLSVFDLSDVGGALMLQGSEERDETAYFSIRSLFVFLCDTLGLDKDKLRISYFAGGVTKKVTDGKYVLDIDLPSDEKIRVWQELGVGRDQLLPDHSRDTLLALHMYGNPTPWGFRHEVNYIVGGKLLDIATFEYLLWRPIFDKNGMIVNLQDWEHSFSIAAVGLERLLMAVNELDDITDCSHIRPLKNTLREAAEEEDEDAIQLAAQSLRAIHSVISDCGKYSNLERHRKEKMRDFYRGIERSFEELNIKASEDVLEPLFKLNADLQQCYPELEDSAKLAAKETAEGIKRLEK